MGMNQPPHPQCQPEAKSYYCSTLQCRLSTNIHDYDTCEYLAISRKQQLESYRGTFYMRELRTRVEGRSWPCMHGYVHSYRCLVHALHCLPVPLDPYTDRQRSQRHRCWRGAQGRSMCHLGISECRKKQLLHERQTGRASTCICNITSRNDILQHLQECVEGVLYECY